MIRISKYFLNYTVIVIGAIIVGRDVLSLMGVFEQRPITFGGHLFANVVLLISFYSYHLARKRIDELEEQLNNIINQPED